eukprot:jgi/Botrbrau1/15001/Bobra.0018s0100.1
MINHEYTNILEFGCYFVQTKCNEAAPYSRSPPQKKGTTGTRVKTSEFVATKFCWVNSAFESSWRCPSIPVQSGKYFIMCMICSSAGSLGRLLLVVTIKCCSPPGELGSIDAAILVLGASV